MAKRQTNAYLSSWELAGGTVFFIIYFLVLPFATGPLFQLASVLLGIHISDGLQNTIYYYVIFALTVLVFHGLLARTTRNLMDHMGTFFKTLGAGLIALYGLNELVYRLTRALMDNQTNLNDVTIADQIDAAPRTTLLIVIFLAPFVEEVLFRGFVFGGLRNHSRFVAYLISCLLFALLHVWQYVWGNQDITYFFLMAQYLVPGIVLAWTYDHSGTLWTSVGLHMVANMMSVLSMRI